MKKLGLLIASIALFFSCSETSQESQNIESSKPNIVFILVDDMGYHDLGCTGSAYYETPNIDQLASESMQFTQGYATCQVCSPSRVSIMTGQYPARHGVTDYIGAPEGEDWRKRNRFTKHLPASYVWQMNLETVNMPEAFKENGYVTFFAGKWHMGDTGNTPLDHGFDINKGGNKKGAPSGGYFTPYNNPDLENGPDGENLTIRLANETANFIESNKDTNFFAYLAFYAVHGPIQTSQEKWEKYRDKAEEMGIDSSVFVMERRLPIRTKQDNPIYGGLVESVDDAVGIVMNALNKNGIEENTIVVFTSDNGGVSSGDNYSTSNLPLRGGKGYQWEAGIREPYFIKVPGSGAAGKTNNTPVTGADFYPTLLDLAGLELKPDQHSDGVSIKTLIEGGAIKERPLFWHYPHYGNQGGDPSSIIRKGDYKLIYYHEDQHLELYNLFEDPAEKYDVYSKRATIGDSLNVELQKWLSSMNVKFTYPDPEWTQEAEDAQYEKMKTKKLSNWENKRKDHLQKGWKPNDDWWGSQIDD